MKTVEENEKKIRVRPARILLGIYPAHASPCVSDVWERDEERELIITEAEEEEADENS